MIYNKLKYKPPFRVGKKQKRAVLDATGIEVVLFRKGDEEMASAYCELLNDEFHSKEIRLKELKESRKRLLAYRPDLYHNSDFSPIGEELTDINMEIFELEWSMAYD